MPATGIKSRALLWVRVGGGLRRSELVSRNVGLPNSGGMAW